MGIAVMVGMGTHAICPVPPIVMIKDAVKMEENVLDVKMGSMGKPAPCRVAQTAGDLFAMQTMVHVPAGAKTGTMGSTVSRRAAPIVGLLIAIS